MFNPGSDKENSISDFQTVYYEELGQECSIAGDWLFDNKDIEDAIFYTQWKQNQEENFINATT